MVDIDNGLIPIGLDLTDAGEVFSSDSDDVGRNALRLRRLVQSYQLSFSVIERCRVPVIAAVHSACVGGGECTDTLNFISCPQYTLI